MAGQAWDGNPVIAHWSLDGAEDDERSDPETIWAIRDTFWVLSRRIKIFASLPHGRANRRSLENKLLALENWQ